MAKIGPRGYFYHDCCYFHPNNVYLYRWCMAVEHYSGTVDTRRPWGMVQAVLLAGATYSVTCYLPVDGMDGSNSLWAIVVSNDSNINNTSDFGWYRF